MMNLKEVMIVYCLTIFGAYGLDKRKISPTYVVEYCKHDTFQPECDLGETIVMQHAMYGRMKVGKCLKRDFFIGCSVDVLNVLDKMCSGKVTCNIPILSPKIEGQVHCLEDLTGYLEAAYYCHKVHIPLNQRCNTPEKIQISRDPTFITSSTSLETSCGLQGSPWILEALPGQHLDITIIDFAWNNESVGLQQCPINYGYILDMESDDVITICGGAKREKYLYQSIGHTVQIIIEANGLETHPFMLEFEAVGCPEYKPPNYAWIQRENDSLLVGCVSSEFTWKLQCFDNNWLGLVGNCTKPPEEEKVMITKISEDIIVKEETIGLPPNISNNHVIVFTSGCLTLLACCVIIIIGIYCTKRYDVKLKKYKSNSTTLNKGGRLTLGSVATTTHRQMTDQGGIQLAVMDHNSMMGNGVETLLYPPAYTFPKNQGPQVPARNPPFTGKLHHQRNSSVVLNKRDSSAYENISTTVDDDVESVQYYILENPSDPNNIKT